MYQKLPSLSFSIFVLQKILGPKFSSKPVVNPGINVFLVITPISEIGFLDNVFSLAGSLKFI